MPPDGTSAGPAGSGVPEAARPARPAAQAVPSGPRAAARPLDERTRVVRGGDPDGSAGGAGARPRGIERLYRYLDSLSEDQFFGKVVVSFQNGKVFDIKVEQTKKLDEL
jgi:hypothetical protein